MPFPIIPAINLGIGALGTILSGRKSARAGSYTHTENPAYAGLQDALIKLAQARLTAPSALPPGYVEGGIQNINRATDLGNQNLQSRLVAMGLSDSPVAANAFANANIARQGALNTFENIQAPAFEQELEQRNFENALNLFGQRRTGTQIVGAGSTAGNAFTTAGELLAYLYGKGVFGKAAPGFGAAPA